MVAVKLKYGFYLLCNQKVCKLIKNVNFKDILKWKCLI